jgi:hypothetical protein
VVADFCKQCSEEFLGFKDRNDMSGKITEEQFQAGYVGTGLCEGCGGGEFAPDGTCLGGCMKHEAIESPGFKP